MGRAKDTDKTKLKKNKIMIRIKYFSAEDARRLVAGEVSEVVVSDDTTIVYKCNQFLCVGHGRECNCKVPHRYITDNDYDAIARYIRVNGVNPWIEFKKNITSIAKIDNSKQRKIRNGDIKKIDVLANVVGYGEYANGDKIGELFYDKDKRVFVVKVYKNGIEYELGGNIMEALTEIFQMCHPIDVNWLEYIELEEYISRAWREHIFNFEVMDIEGNTWYSCNKDKDGKILPIMDWHIGNSDSNLKKSIRDVVSGYHDLIEKGYILNSMIVKLMMDSGE